MLNRKPKVGLLLLAADWFWQQNIQGSGGRYSRVPQLVASDMAALSSAIADDLELITVGLVHNLSQARAAVKRFRAADIDLLLISSIIWSEDQPLIEVLRGLPDVPLLVWCFAPSATLPSRVSVIELFRRSGPVGTVQHSAPLRRLGRTFGFVCGAPGDPAIIRSIREYAAAARVAKALKRVTIGLLPGHCEAMTGTFTDAKRLKKAIGPVVKKISVAQYAASVATVPKKEAEAFAQHLRKCYPLIEVSWKSLLAASRASLGIAKLAEKQQLDAIALNDLAPELHRALGMRPFLAVPEFFAAGRVIGMEGDVTTTMGLLIMRYLSDSPPMYTEIYTFDEKRNGVLAGHASMHDLRLAESPRGIRITPDYEYCEVNPLEGAWLEFRAKPGRVTLASFFGDVARFKVVIAEGQALRSGPRLQGFAHIFVKLDTPVADFFQQAIKTGITQHWVITHANIRSQLRHLAGILNMECVEI